MKIELTQKTVSKNIPLIFQEIKSYESIDSRFIKVKIWLMHLGENFNGSIFSKESVLKAIPSLANTPILAFVEKNKDGNEDFSDHRMSVKRKSDGEITIEYEGDAIGTIPESCNPQFETRVTDSGIEREYLTVEGLLWTKWDKYVDIMETKGIIGQSMEIADDYSGEWNSEGLFEFDDFKFFGACLLGDDVMPAMENSTVELQFSKNNSIQNFIENKLNEFNSLFSKEGGKEKMENEEMEKEVEQDFEKAEVEAPKEEVKEDFETEKEEEIKEEPKVDFALTMEQLKDALRSAVSEPKFTKYPGTEDEYESRKYWLVDFTNEVVIVEDSENGYSLVQINYTVTDGGSVSLDFNSAIPVMIQFVPVQENVTPSVSLESFKQFEDVKKDFENKEAKLNEEIKQLSEFKRNTEEATLYSEFSHQFSKEEAEKIFSENKEKSIEEIENVFFALLGKKNYSLIKEEEKKDTKINFNLKDKEEDSEKTINEPYNGLFSRLLPEK